jgi:Uma2 family endonuclease
MTTLTPTRTAWTVDDVEALPYDEWHRYEVIEGELIMTSAPHAYHQRVAFRLTLALDEWCEATGAGEVFEAAGVIFSPINGVIPDVLWISKERKAQLMDEAGHFRGAPELLVEVLSPGSTNQQRDRSKKLELYSHFGVLEYWLADWPAQRLEVYRQEQGALRLAATLGPEDDLTTDLLPGFRCSLRRLFRH